MKKGSSLYAHIYQSLLADINNGKYQKGTRLPTEKEIQSKYLVSRITASKALDTLEEDGFIVRISGKGSYVRRDMPSEGRLPAVNNRLIALVMGGYSSAFGLNVINGALEACEKLGYNLIVKKTDNDKEKETNVLQEVKLSGALGIIIQASHNERSSQWVMQNYCLQYPLVMIDRAFEGIEVSYVGTDNFHATQTAVEYLLDLGHRNIALVSLANKTASTLKARIDGYMKAFAKRGLPIMPELCQMELQKYALASKYDIYSQESNNLYVEVILNELKKHPDITAMFCTEYQVAVSAYKAAKSAGLSVPEDLSIVSFDAEYGDDDIPRLTHIQQPQKELGFAAVELLHTAITKQSSIVPKKEFKARLIDCGSATKPRARNERINK